jgi:hypothetical protein
MSLPATQEHLLLGLEGELQASEPRLAAMFAIFTRLARDEELPRLEQLTAEPRRLWEWLNAARRRWSARVGRLTATTKVKTGARALLLLVPLTLMVLMFASISVGSPSSRVTCRYQARLATPASHAKTCVTAAKPRDSYIWRWPGRATAT